MYTLDAAGKVSAFSTSGGSPVWRVSVTPPNEKDREGFGGGLAADGGRIYAATGYGVVVALDARSGSKLWEKNVGSPVRSSPTAAAERVFAVTKEGLLYCLSGSDGTELWQFRGMGERASLLSNTSPAVDGGRMHLVPPAQEVLYSYRLGVHIHSAAGPDPPAVGGWTSLGCSVSKRNPCAGELLAPAPAREASEGSPCRLGGFVWRH